MRPPAKARPGDAGPVREIGPITQTDIVRFAGAGGDFNPLHHDPGFARAAGFGTVIAMGQLQAGLLAAWLTDWLGIENLREYEVRFAAPVALGDVLQLTGEVVAVDTQDGVPVAEVAQRVERDGDLVVKARAKVRLAQ